MFRVVLADPPWQFRVRSRKGLSRSAENHYHTADPRHFYDLPLAAVCERDAVLFMWVTWPTLLEGIALGQAWGFTYKTCGFLWTKTNRSTVGRFGIIHDPANYSMGTGYYTRANTEPCLLFTRGRPRRLSRAVRQLVVAPVGAHSAKPPEVHARIEQLFAGPYLELFGRQLREGWTVLGDEIDGLDIHDALKLTLANSH